mmetsp:Transcript_8511/g.14332  ORF Transcript_8511/g.14332 Transcript_8511/m.14332 type:complete len:271 (+) Transcript_8511:690-1502(+)
MGEIKKFAQDVIPHSSFIFDDYKISDDPSFSKKQNEYFSFFSSHEQVLLRPESNFSNIQELMNFLPIDYYILLQKGYKPDSNPSLPKKFVSNKKTGFLTRRWTPSKQVECVKGTDIPRSNILMFMGLPVLNKGKRTFKGRRDYVTQLKYGDLMNNLSYQDALALITDPMAERELISHLNKQFNARVRKFQYVNFNPHQIMNAYQGRRTGLENDKLLEFEDFFKSGRNAQSSEQDEMLEEINPQISQFAKDRGEFKEILDLHQDFFDKGSF